MTSARHFLCIHCVLANITGHCAMSAVSTSGNAAADESYLPVHGV